MESVNLKDNAAIRTLKKEYLLKKKSIARRLDEFDKFYSEPYSWFYEDGRMQLKKTEKTDDERIFEELCFCIFTANTSAEMGMKAVDRIRDILISGSVEDMSRRLEGVYRFNNLRPSYIVHTRDYLKKELGFKLKDKIESLREDREALRDFFAFNKGIKGLGYKEASHFLRNIGMKGYAILDKHVLNSLVEFNVLEEIKMPLKRQTYRDIEQKLRIFSNEISIPMDELDLLLWSRKNGKILK